MPGYRPFYFIRAPCQSNQNCSHCLITISKAICNIFIMHHLISNVHILQCTFLPTYIAFLVLECTYRCSLTSTYLLTSLILTYCCSLPQFQLTTLNLLKYIKKLGGNICLIAVFKIVGTAAISQLFGLKTSNNCFSLISTQIS